jgi:hypothetical protein
MTSPAETNAASGRPDATMQVIPTDECYRLLATQEIGRIGVNAEHYPLILPVNYGLDGTPWSSGHTRGRSCGPPNTPTSPSRSTRSIGRPGADAACWAVARPRRSETSTAPS